MMRNFQGRSGRLRKEILSAFVALCASAAFCAQAQAQGYPSRPVKIVVPYPAGGTGDAMARIVADWLARKWDQAVVIENRTGAGGNIGTELVATSEPDGYTLLSTPQSPLVINQHLYSNLRFNPAELAPVVILGRVPNALVAGPAVKAATIAELIDYARANPDRLTSATQGNGTSSHLTSELFQMMASIKLRQVPYRGSAPALQDLLGGNVDLMFDNLGTALPLVQSGKLKLLAVTTPKRMAAFPDVPAVAETLPGFESATWNAMVAPRNTPKAIIDKINADVNEALRQPEVIERYRKLSAELVGGSPEAAAAYIREETERWRTLIKSAGIKLE